MTPQKRKKSLRGEVELIEGLLAPSLVDGAQGKRWWRRRRKSSSGGGGGRPAAAADDKDDDDVDGFYFLQLGVEAEVRVTSFPLQKVAHGSGGGLLKFLDKKSSWHHPPSSPSSSVGYPLLTVCRYTTVTMRRQGV